MLADIAERADPARRVEKAVDWEPLWLGPPGRRLYAALHHASGRAKVGVVVAPPLLSEQPRSRRLMFEIAGVLAAQGLPCLRFDYYGTGDSEGDAEAHDLAAICADLDAAVSRLREHAGLTRVAVMAWRGAALAACDWALRNPIDALILCDPVMDGAAWLAELESADRRERVSRERYPHGAGAGEASDGQLMGYPVSAGWRHGVSALRLSEIAPGARAAIWAVLRNATGTPEWARRMFVLPSGTPRFDGQTRMDATLFLSPQLRALIGELGRELTRLES
ncbi:MAG: serine aminopeptidase domain-containing protein [Rhodanobacteraceae bacterium]